MKDVVDECATNFKVHFIILYIFVKSIELEKLKVQKIMQVTHWYLSFVIPLSPDFTFAISVSTG